MVGSMNDVRARAERLLREPVRLADLALAFDETVASTVDVQVGGRNFFPPMLRDIGSASSSIHINQFGFRPGAIREQFAAALLAKVADGVRSGSSWTHRVPVQMGRVAGSTSG